ncbi:MAG: hypothetical protein DWQ51_11295 [Microcystis wesenbergii TW10]|uniref:Uncharacterized protein n=2 Tax=Microcystis TaxID=1125 RepID=A0A552A7Z2_MICAE|nr:MAG: hypothetical protein DWQ51_11295 [Microcystis wesenbergii TW10]TRT81581.1 MAG: hypothetical protein EWV63_21840 [Microcystis aeruginosa Ma_OC_H_19870700_S124]
MIHESTLPYQGGQGGSNLKSIFNLIITSYLSCTEFKLRRENFSTNAQKSSPCSLLRCSLNE